MATTVETDEMGPMAGMGAMVGMGAREPMAGMAEMG